MIPTPRPPQMPPLPRAELSDLPRRSARLCRARLASCGAQKANLPKPILQSRERRPTQRGAGRPSARACTTGTTCRAAAVHKGLHEGGVPRSDWLQVVRLLLEPPFACMRRRPGASARHHAHLAHLQPGAAVHRHDRSRALDGEAPRFRPHRAARLRPAPNGLQVMLRSLFGPPAHHFTCSTLAPGRRVFACAARIVVFSFDSGLPGRADARGALRRLFFSARGQLGRAQGVRRGAQHPSHPSHAQPTSRPTAA